MELIKNIAKLHTTELGAVRIRRNLGLDCGDVVEWCRDQKPSSSAAARTGTQLSAMRSSP